MGLQTDNVFPSGGMDKDKDLSLIDPHDYTDALNIQHITQGGQTSYAIQPTLGNILAFTIPATSVQNKQYQILMQDPGGTLARQITIYDTNGNVIAVVGWSDSSTIANTYTNFTNALTAIGFGSLSPNQTYTVSLSGNYALFTLTTVSGYEYSIVDTQGVNFTPINALTEAWDASLTGNAHVIGSRDILGQLWTYSTPQTNLPTILSGTFTVSNVSGSLIRVTTSVPNVLSTGQSVTISGVTGTDSNLVNGTWIVNVISSTAFDLYQSVWNGSISISGGTITTNVSGIGEIGVGVYNPNTASWAYTTLLKSKELNFRTAYQIDAYGEQNNFETSNYYTDNYNPPRVFYYLNGPFVTNGAITVINPTGQYQYGNIASESVLIFSNSGVQFSFTGQSVGGGGIQSGNWRYAIALLTSSFGMTNYSDLSNIVVVYLADQTGNPAAIYGDEPAVITSKVNHFVVTNIPQGIFEYIQLVGINYVDGAIVGTSISQIPINGTTMNITHTGKETGSTNLDVATLNQFSFDIETAKNIEAIDNRLILSNLSTSTTIDFSAWAKTLKHSLKQQTIEGIGLASNATVNHNFGEYQDPLNTYNYMGYAQFETYRIMVKFVLRSTGNFTQCFWVDDIRIDDSATNITTPNRRVSGLPNLDLTPVNSAVQVLVPYIEIDNINLDYPINGVPLRQLVSEIHFERVERFNGKAQVLGTGIFVLAAQAAIANISIQYGPAGLDYGEYPYTGGWEGQHLTDVGNADWNILNTVAKMYCPDILCGNTTILWEAGDKIYNLSQPQTQQHIDVAQTSGQTYDSDITDYNGYVNGSSSTLSVINVAAATNIQDGGSDVSANPSSPINFYGIMTIGNITKEWLCKGGPVVSIGSGGTGSFGNFNGQTSYGVRYGAYFRPIPYLNVADPTTSGQYGDPAINQSVPTGSIVVVPATNQTTTVTLSVTGATNPSHPSPIVITTASNTLVTGQTVSITGVIGQTAANGIWQIIVLSNTTFSLVGSLGSGAYSSGGTVTVLYTTQSVFGGDVFTQKTYILNRTNETTGKSGGASGIGFYSQNVVNSNMIFKNTSNGGEWNFPNITTVGWMSQASFYSSIAPYNSGYTYNNGVSVDTSFNSRLPVQTQLPTEIRWSDLKPQNAITDNFRIFLPLNFFDLPMTFGPIEHHANFNGELFTWQPRMVQRQYFNTRGTMNVGGGAATEVLIGDGSVMSRPGQLVTVIGTANKWSVVKGKSDQGNDTIYWINTELKKSMRMGYDGTIKISDIHGMQSFFANNLTWVNGIDTPANGQGICGTWDDRYLCVLWSVMGKISGIQVYDSGTTYAANAVVQYTPTVFSTFEQTGEFYVSVVAGNIGNEPDTNPSYWVLIPHLSPTDSITVNGVTYYANQYYNEYTIEFNEQKNKFTTRYSFKPRIYLKWTDTFLTPMPQPSSNSGQIYQHRLGNYCTWYGSDIANGFITLIYNKQINDNKRFAAVWFSSILAPYLIKFYTAKYQTFIQNTDFENNIDFWTSAIKNDILASSDGQTNTQDTSAMFGRYLQMQVFFQAGVFNTVTDMVLKFLMQNRLSSK